MTGLGSLVVMSCLGCSAPQTTDVIRLDAGPVPDGQAFSNDQYDRNFSQTEGSEPYSYITMPKRGSTFGPDSFAAPQDAARFKAMDLSTPQPIRRMAGDRFGGEVSFSASSEKTGLGLDVAIAPRYQIQQDRGGANAVRAGAEFRVGQNLSDRDLRRKGSPTSSWYFFMGADNEALVWNMADRSSVNGLTLNNQTTIGDLQAGVAWSLADGKLSFGMVERRLKYNDPTGDHDVKRKDHFAAFTYSLRK